MKPHPTLEVERLKIMLHPNPMRVLVRPFTPSLSVGPEGVSGQPDRVKQIGDRVLAMSESDVAYTLNHVLREFNKRHRKISDVFDERFEQVRSFLQIDHRVSKARARLLGAYFTSEYSLEASALFNPSMVPHPDQNGLPAGSLRFILSLRATGEGHISSITFRTGVLHADGVIQIDSSSHFVNEPGVILSKRYHRELFKRKLGELHVRHECVDRILDRLSEFFTDEELRAAIEAVEAELGSDDPGQISKTILTMAHSNCTARFEKDSPMSERVLFPIFPSQSNGIEDARFVLFTDDTGERRYYATYTAYDGHVIMPQMLETADFEEFDFCTLNGPSIQNKGLALFPRKVDGSYLMLGRQDSENTLLMRSDHPHFWYSSEVVVRPVQPWELVQLGNCGSPLETEKGWLVLTHGVGPMRKYCIGALLLDLADPSKVVARMKDPLLSPEDDERDGYVPNVVYSCGGMLQDGHLVLPYAISDTATRFARIKLENIFAAME